MYKRISELFPKALTKSYDNHDCREITTDTAFGKKKNVSMIIHMYLLNFLISIKAGQFFKVSLFPPFLTMYNIHQVHFNFKIWLEYLLLSALV